MTRLARIALGAAALAVAIVAVWAAAETAAPFLQRSSCGGGRAPLWRPRADVGWALIPGATGEVVVCEGEKVVARQAVAINDLGQRDRPRALAREGGRARVLVLGDSLVEANQVALADTFAARLEERLGVEVLNGGVSGYATDNQLRFFDAAGARYAPDVVLLVFFVGNDVAENGARLYFADSHGLPPKPWLDAPAAPPLLARCMALHRLAARAAESMPEWLWRRSRLLRAALTSGADGLLRFACASALGPPAVPGGPERLGVYEEPATLPWREAWSRSEELLLALRDAVERRGARFAVAIAPAGIEIDPRLRLYELNRRDLRDRDWDYGAPHRRLESFLDAHGIAWLSLDGPLREHLRTSGRPGYFVGDGHWNEEGHAVVAEALEPFVAALLGDRPS